MTDPSRLAGLIKQMRSDCSFFEARGLEQFTASLLHHIPALEAIAGVGSAGPVPEGVGLPASGAPDRLLTVGEVAVRLGVSTSYVYRHARKWPFTKRLGGTKGLRFSERGLWVWTNRRSA